MGKDKKHGHDHADNSDLIAKSLESEGKHQQWYHTKRMNRFWLWLGVLILVAILLWWIFSIGFVEDTTGYTNFGT